MTETESEIDPHKQTPIHLYYVPIETLGLSEKCLQILKTVFPTVGDTVDQFKRRPGDVMYTLRSDIGDIEECMAKEVEPALIQQGYWSPDESLSDV